MKRKKTRREREETSVEKQKATFATQQYVFFSLAV
jgi:hypothetical protein